MNNFIKPWLNFMKANQIYYRIISNVFWGICIYLKQQSIILLHWRHVLDHVLKCYADKAKSDPTEDDEDKMEIGNYFSLHANPLARSRGQVKLDSDKWKFGKNLFSFWASLWKKLWRSQFTRNCLLHAISSITVNHCS